MQTNEGFRPSRHFDFLVFDDAPSKLFRCEWAICLGEFDEDTLPKR
nr:hypothetical protein [Natranaeroarchaeum sulfidigenes]